MIPRILITYNRYIFSFSWWFWKPQYQNHMGKKEEVFAWTYRIGPLYIQRVKTNEEFAKEWAE